MIMAARCARATGLYRALLRTARSWPEKVVPVGNRSSTYMRDTITKAIRERSVARVPPLCCLSCMSGLSPARLVLHKKRQLCWSMDARRTMLCGCLSRVTSKILTYEPRVKGSVANVCLFNCRRKQTCIKCIRCERGASGHSSIE